METLEIIGGVVGFLLTLMIFSYVLGDNALFRIGAHLLIGVSAGYATVLILYNILWQRLALPLVNDPVSGVVLLVPPFLLGVWVLLKASPRMAALTTPVMAFLVGIGSAAAIGGAVMGTLIPQTSASINMLAPQDGASGNWLLNNLVILVGTLTALASFHFTTRSQNPALAGILSGVTQVGKVFIAIALGALFAGVYAAAIAAFVGRTYALWDFIWKLIESF